MTGKQIIIDGVDVSGCERHCSDNRNNPNMCYSEMNETYSKCNPKEKQCNFYITSIEKQLKRKEQECKKLRFPMKDNNYAILTKEEFENFNQFKKENKQLKQTLAEIKEIAENNKRSVLCFTAFEGDTIEVNNEPMATILQKINECEV